MASTSVLKLSVDDKQYNASLKQAAQGMKHLEQTLKDSGKTFTQVDKSVVNYVSEIGKMESQAKTAKGKIGEMSNAFVELSVQYKKMTDEEKQSPFGKALSESLGTLKERIKAGKDQMKEIGNEMNSTGGIMSQLTNKLTLNIDAFKLLNLGLSAAKTSLDVAKDAFFQNETNVDNWGRTITASEHLYQSFLQTLNNGDFSGFLSRISEVIAKAKEAYNAMDELSTRMTIINPERTKLQARATELKATIRRSGAGSEEGKAAQQALKSLEPQLANSFKTESQLNMNAFKAQVNARLKDAGIILSKSSYDFLMKTFSSDEAYQRMRNNARGKKGSEYVAGGSYDEGTTYSYDSRNTNQKLLDLFTDEWRREYSPLLNAAFGARGQAASTMLADARYLKEGRGGGGGRTGGSTSTNEVTYAADSIAAQEKLVSELTKKWREAGASVRDDYKAQLDEAKTKLQEMTNPSAPVMKIDPTQIGTPGSVTGYENIFDGMKEGVTGVISPLQALNDELKRLQEGQALALTPEQWQIWQEAIDKTNKKISDFTGGGKEGEKSWKNAATAVQAVGSAMQGIEDPAAKVMGTIGQAIASIALGFAQATTAESGKGVWAWIAAVAGGLATMVSTISAIHSATGYAQGGIVDGRGGGFVPGSSFSGDNLVGNVMLNSGELGNVMLNSGELILNKSQQNSLANVLTGNPMSSMRLSAVVSGEQILLVANRTTRRQGRGELVTFR